MWIQKGNYKTEEALIHNDSEHTIVIPVACSASQVNGRFGSNEKTRNVDQLGVDQRDNMSRDKAVDDVDGKEEGFWH